jgi:hypothetical protein
MNERELIARAIDALEATTAHFTRIPSTLSDTQVRGYAHATMHMMRAYLAAPVAPAEPVATLHDDGWWTTKDTEAGRLLNSRLRHAGTRVDVYTAPVAPALVPLTDEQIEAGCEAAGYNAFKASAFYEGARFAEQSHGIKP